MRFCAIRPDRPAAPRRHRTTRFSTPFLAAALAALAAGCGSGPPAQVVTRDSAGVAITLSSAPAWPAGTEWRVSDEPVLTIGGLSGQARYDLTNVVDARRFDDGRILVTQCSPPQVHLYDPSGGFIRAFGGLGNAPGRCQFILHSWLAAPDTLLVYDPTLGRLNRYSLDGQLLGVDPVGAAADDEGIVWVGRFADGSLLGRPNRPPPTADGRTRATFAYVRAQPGSATTDTILTAAGAEYVAEGVGSDAPRVEQVLFSPFTEVLALDSTVLVADTRDFWIEEWTQDGRLLRRFGRSFEPRPIDRDFVRAYKQQRLAAAGSRARDVRAELDRAVFAEKFPAHEGTMLTDPTGDLWVLDYPGASEQARAWSVFDPSGRWLGDVQLPRELRVTDVGTDHVVGVWRDADGTQTVRVFDLDRSGAGQAAGGS